MRKLMTELRLVIGQELIGLGVRLLAGVKNPEADAWVCGVAIGAQLAASAAIYGRDVTAAEIVEAAERVAR